MDRAHGTERWLAGSILTLAIVANIPHSVQTQLGINRTIVILTLAAILVVLLTRHLKALLVVATGLLIVGANLPDPVATELNISTPLLFASLVGLVLVAVLNRALDVLPAGTSPRPAHGTQALMHAVERGQVALVGRLVESGVDLNRPGPDGKQVLTRAVELGNVEVVSLLLRAGADANMPDAEGRRPLARARQLGHVPVARVLRAYGAQ